MTLTAPLFKTFSRLFLIAIALWFANATTKQSLADTDFVPKESLPFLEKWRWRKLEPLQHKNLITGAEAQDGSLWFAASGGLISYDGFETKRFPFPEEFKEVQVFQLFASRNGKLYVYTTKGLLSFRDSKWKTELAFESTIYSKVRDFMVRNSFGVEFVAIPNSLYRIDGEVPEELTTYRESPISLAIDDRDRLWAALNILNEIESIQSDSTGIPANAERKIYNPQGERTWLYNLIIASPKSKDIWAINWRASFPPIRHSGDSEKWTTQDLSDYSGDNAHVGGLFIAPETLLIISKTNTLISHKGKWHQLDNSEFEIPTNDVFAFLRQNGNLIIGGTGESIYEIEFSKDRWYTLPQLHFQCESSNKSLWYISIDGKIIEHDSVYDKWESHTLNTINSPVGLLRTDDDFIWAYGSHDNVPAIAYYNGRAWTRIIHPELSGSIGHQAAIQLKSGDILFGSSDVIPPPGKGGLVRYQKNKNDTYSYAHVPPPLAPVRPASFAEDSQGDVWFGGRGLYRTDANFSSPAIPVPPFSEEPWIDQVVSDHTGDIWVALWNKGLFQKDGAKWIHYSAPDQIRENQVSFIHKDQFKEGHLWIGTSKGVSRFDGENWFPHCLPGNIRFNRESGTLKQSSDGAIWVNMAQRNWFFREGSDFSITPQLRKSFKTTRYSLDSTPPQTSILHFDAESTYPSSLIVEWTATDNWSATPRNQLRYSYRLNEENWSPYSLKGSTTLLETPAGNHRLQVRAVDMDGNVSAPPAEVNFKIHPPIWQRAWFIASIAAAALTIAILIAMLIKQGIRHIIQIEEFKIQFFTNISHELRTPLTVILGPLESLIKKNKGSEDRAVLELAHKNAQKMLLLIDQLLDFRSAEQGNIKMNISHADLIESIRETVSLIKPLADERSQSLTLEINRDSCLAWFDSEKIEKILNNLISNAIKYTQTSGSIKVVVNVSENEIGYFIRFIVEDNGTGIPSEKIDNIFELFYRAGNTPENKVRGSGIGLSYTKNIIEACEGNISVESPITTINGKQQGTRFIVEIPVEKHRSTPNQPKQEITLDGNDQEKSIDSEIPEIATERTHALDRPVILVAEDDDDIRAFLTSELKDDYEILEARDGLAGWQQASIRIPDLILTDVMMPNMDGKDLCRKIKSTESTCHIPIILLTALKSETHEISGLEAGANDYISKPINSTILKKRIHNLLQSRDNIHDQFKRLNPGAKIHPKKMTGNPLDESFLTKAINAIEINTDDPLFDVEGLAKALNMSRMTLYRKFKAVTGDSPSVFIKSIRMSKAAEHLKGEQYNISEISDLVGFSDLSHFSTAFKKHFNCTPSQYREQFKEQET